jgi:hypothetical protein
MRKNNNIIKVKGWAWNPENLQLIRDYVWTCPVSIHGKWESEDGFIKIIDDKWYFNEGFSYNACTWVPSGGADKTPDLPVISLNKNPVPLLWLATLIHDGGYTHMVEDDFPFDRSEIDYFFFFIAKSTTFRCPYLYYLGVSLY